MIDRPRVERSRDHIPQLLACQEGGLLALACWVLFGKEVEKILTKVLMKGKGDPTIQPTCQRCIR